MRVGDIYGQLTVVSLAEPRKAVCVCTCGEKKSFWRTNLTTGKSTSCGHSTYTIGIGDVFGEWTVTQATKPRAVVRCSCDEEREVYVYSLFNGDSTSCGHAVKTGPRARLKWMWSWMMSRTTNEGDPMYRYYGARGITVCEKWAADPDAYIDWAIEQGFKKGAGLQVDRIDNDGPYSPENCRVTTRTVNANNKTPEFHRMATAWGETKTLGQWAADERCAVDYPNLWARINSGWGHERAISAPPLHGGGRRRQLGG